MVLAFIELTLKQTVGIIIIVISATLVSLSSLVHLMMSLDFLRAMYEATRDKLVLACSASS